MIRKGNLFRSLLFTPGDRIKAMEKAKGLRCDAAIFDLEDAVATTQKEVAIANVIGCINNWKDRNGMNSFVRVNGLDTNFGRKNIIDLVRSFESSPTIDGILIPKVSSVKLVDEVSDILVKNSSHTIPIWCMIETPHGVHNVEDIALHPLVQGIIFGSNDLSKELKAKQVPSREPLLYSMSKVINACRMHNKIVIDGVFNDYKNEILFRDHCVQGKHLGFDGKSLIHPDQISVCNEVYSPTKEELDWAKLIVHQWESKRGEEVGVITVNSRMVEKLHIDEAVELLKLYEP